MQALACEVVRALTKLGIAMAARRPMMATTIMISTSVKPALFEVLIFIPFVVITFLFIRGERSDKRVTMIAISSTDCLSHPWRRKKQRQCQKTKEPEADASGSG